MPIPVTLATLEGLPESIPRSEVYSLDPNTQQYRVALDQEFELKTDVDGLRTALEAEREQRKGAERTSAERQILIDKFGDMTPEQIKEMQDRLESMKDKQILDDEGIDELLKRKLEAFHESSNQREAALVAQAKEIEEKYSASEQSRRSLVFQQQIAEAARSVEGFYSGALPDVQSRAVSEGFTVNERDQVVQLDQAGEVINGRNGVQAKTLQEWLEDAAKDEGKAHWFQQAHGGGIRGRNGVVTGIPVDTSKMKGRDIVKLARQAERQVV